MKWFYDLKTKTKLITAFSTVLILTVIVGYTGANGLYQIIPSFESMYIDRLEPAMDLSDVVVELYEIRLTVLNHYLTSLASEQQKMERSIAEHDARIDDLIRKYSATYLVEEEKEQLAEFNKNLTDYRQSRSHSLELSAGNRKAEALINIREVAGPLFKKVAATTMKLIDIQGSVGKELYEASERKASYITTELYIIMGIAMALSFILALFIARVISKSVKELAEHAEQMAGGDLTVEVIQHSKDEFGQLAGSFKNMVENLRETLIQVAEASSAVASASTEISSSTEQMAAGAQEQSSQAGEVAAAVEEMTKTISENATNATSTASTAKKAKEAAESGGNIVRGTVEGMREIAKVVNKSAETVKALGKSSDQIGEIIGVIDDIADQTNLLALNAAIEAARAGEQGRGFAVVADEVRKLAERTTKATKEIATMIKQIQQDTKGAVVSMNEGTTKVDEGIVLADKAGDSLKDIVKISQEVTDMVTQIAAGSEQQSSASEQISKNVEAISTVTQQSASGIQQIAHTAEDLNQLTENLRNIIEKFNLGNQTRESNSYGKKSSLLVDKSGSLRRTRQEKLFDFSNAKNAHKMWRLRIQKLLMGVESIKEQDLVSHKECKLGKWYYTDGSKTCGHDPVFAELGIVHEQMHDKVRDVVRLFNNGKKEQAEIEAAKINKYSNSVIELLDQLEHASSVEHQTV